MKQNIYIAAIITVSVLILAAIFDLQSNNGAVVNNLLYKKDCSFIVPEGYSIYYSDQRKKYAVKVHEYGDYYLYDGKHGITTMFSYISEPSLFYDSCTAKSYLKTYLSQQKQKFK